MFFAVLPRPMKMEMTMATVLFPTMAPVIARGCVRVFRLVFAAWCTVLGVRLLGNGRRLSVMILSMMRHSGRGVIGRKWNIDVFLGWSGKGQGS
jgi:hypothetical protein